MKNSAMTIGSAALKLIQDKATITPPKEVDGTVDAFVAKQEAKTAARKRKADVATGAKNSQSDTVGAKGKVNRVEAGKIDVTKIMAMPATLSGTETVGDICARILSVHTDLVAGQITQLEAFIAQGQAISGLRAKLLADTGETDAKKVNRAFGEALKTAGIGADIIPRDSRDCYEFVGANADAVRQFVSTDSKMIKKAQSIKLSPYIIKAAMTGTQKESAGDTLEKLVANIVTRADALNVTKAQLIAELQKAGFSA